jgi:xanthine dehydrogenase iron-sulfur cluster and FAD-binding subunit A
MTRHLSEYLVPTGLDQALALLRTRGDSAAVVGGGTVQALHLPTRVTALIDLTRCGLETIEVNAKRAAIGATVSTASIAANTELDPFGSGMLREAAAAVSPQAVRNQVTIAGNIAGYLSWSDLPVALAALDAEVNTVQPGGKQRSLSITALFAGHPRKILETGELIVAVEIPRPMPHTGGAFIKIAKTAADLALANAAALLQVENGVCKRAALAFGAVQPRPGRATKAEERLVGRRMTEALCGEAAKLAAQAAVVHTDMRASKGYRHQLLEIAIKRAITSAWRRAVGDEAYDAPRRMAPPPWPRTPAGEACGRVLSVIVDGAPRSWPIKPSDLLLDVLRCHGVTSVKRGCDEGYCGSCSVLVGGRLLNACLVLAAHVDGLAITTVQGIGTVMHPHPLQTALVDEGAVQCGFCTPGFVVAAKSFLDQIPDPTDEELRLALDGNLCRCTGYVKQLAAIHSVAKNRHSQNAR